MHGYASNYMKLAYVIVDDPHFVALQRMGKSIVPFLLQDLQRSRKEWLNTIRARKDMFDVWAITLLLWLARDAPPPILALPVPRDQKAIRKGWLKWGQRHGYLPKERGLLVRWFFVGKLYFTDTILNFLQGFIRKSRG